MLLSKTRLVSALIFGLSLMVVGAPISTATAVNHTVPVDLVLNALKCEVARYQEKNKDYNKDPAARFVIKDATIRIVLRLVEVKTTQGGGGIEVRIPVLSAKSIVNGRVDVSSSATVLEEQAFVFDMNTSASRSTVCQHVKKSLDIGGSIFKSLERAKAAIEKAAAGEPRVRVRTHEIRRRMTIIRKSEKEGSAEAGLFFAFLRLSGGQSTDATASHELEMTFRLGRKESDYLSLEKSAVPEIVERASAKDTPYFSQFSEIFKQGSSGGHGGLFFLCNKANLEECGKIPDWAAVSPCQLRPSLPSCSGVKGGSDGGYFRRGPVIVGPRALLSEELKKAGGWSLSPTRKKPGDYNQLILNRMSK